MIRSVKMLWYVGEITAINPLFLGNGLIAARPLSHRVIEGPRLKLRTAAV